MNLPSLILDVVAVLVVLLCCVFYARRGFVAGILSFFGTLIALVVASAAAGYLAPAIFERFFAEGMQQDAAQMINNQGISSLEGVLENLLGFLPESLRTGIADLLDPVLDFDAADIAEQVVGQVVRPLMEPLIMALLFFVLFTILRALFGIVRSLATGINRLPALGTLNRVLGGAMGLLVSLLYLYIGLCVLWAYDAVNVTEPVVSQYMGNSVLYRMAQPLNFFASSGGLQGLL